MSRYIIQNSDQYALVEQLLDDAGIDYDWDDGDRLMVDDDFCEDAEAIFDENDVDYDCI